jgi:hypothetical protein
MQQASNPNRQQAAGQVQYQQQGHYQDLPYQDPQYQAGGYYQDQPPPSQQQQQHFGQNGNGTYGTVLEMAQMQDDGLYSAQYGQQQVSVPLCCCTCLACDALLPRSFPSALVHAA